LKNDLKRRLKAGEKTLGLWTTIESPVVSELLSGLGFDWFVFDLEHSPMEVYTAQTLMQAMRGPTTPIIRVEWNDPVPIKRALDVGAYGLVIPWVNNREEAKKAVAACKYPPEGIRGCGPRRCSLFDPDYLKTANEEVLVVAQIETKEAVENVEEVASVDGVDVLFIGPSDLSASYGYLGKPEEPVVQRAIDKVLAATREAGIAAGIYTGGGKTLRDRYEEGFQFIAIGGDLDLLRRGAAESLKPFKKREG
jgi:2-keto-3-deoxy-L-rhamnonate aldolase RhmA